MVLIVGAGFKRTLLRQQRQVLGCFTNLFLQCFDKSYGQLNIGTCKMWPIRGFYKQDEMIIRKMPEETIHLQSVT